MAYSCELCDISSISSPILLEGHLAGKKHLRNLEHKKALEKIAERSVFLSKFHDPTDEHAIEKSVDKFGEIDRIIIDKQNSSYAIVEFKDADVAKDLIITMKKLQIGKNLVSIQPRRMDFASKPLIHALYSADVVDYLSHVKDKSFVSQIDELMNKFCMTHEMVLEREIIAKRLEEFLQKFFASKVCVKIFGSSATGLGLVNSDLDIMLLLPNEVSGREDYDDFQCCSSSPSEVWSDETKCALPSDIQSILTNPISREDFLRLPNHSKARLINRIINFYRKDSGTISCLIPILDARCPVVRFVLRKPNVLCELSIQNILGNIKANFIRHVVGADTSGICRKFMFAIKLWAHIAGIFSPDNAHPHAHWNSYTLSLLVVSFLQSRKLIPAILIKQDSRKVQGWCVDYEPLHIDLQSQNISQLFKGFFNFLYNSLQSVNIHCVRDAVVYSKEAFESRFFDGREDNRIASKFKFSLVNVQDPLELSHNVASNVSKGVSLMRQSLMYSITVLKNNPEDLAGLFQLEAIRLQWASTKKPCGLGQVVSVNVGPERSPAVVVQNFISVMKDVLLLEKVQEPKAKRSRCCAEEYDGDLLHDNGHSLQFLAQFPVWMGRRQIRRQMCAKSSQLDPLQLEREVSSEIRSRSAASLELKFGVQLYFEDNQMHCIFQMDKQQSAQDLYHFFATFIPRYLAKVPKENICGESAPIIQKSCSSDIESVCKDCSMDID